MMLTQLKVHAQLIGNVMSRNSLQCHVQQVPNMQKRMLSFSDVVAHVYVLT